MPTLLPPPPVYTPEKKEQRPRTPQGPGSGGRPPYRKRTGGGGDNDDNGFGGRGPQERLRRARPALIFFLIGDTMLFLALVVGFLVDKSSTHAIHGQIVNSWQAIPIPPILWLNTAVLLLSTITMEIARRRIFHEQDVMDEWLGFGKPAARRALPWLLATCALGAIFLAGQWTAWRQLAMRHGYEAVYQDAGLGHTFFNLFTGFHAAHLVVGLFALTACLSALLYSRSVETRQVWLDTAAWYWHCMGIFWIGLFVLLVWGQ